MAENKLENLDSKVSQKPKEKITFGDLEEKSKKEDSIGDNIFDGFDTDKSLKTEVSKLTKENNKDFYFYIKGIGKIFQILFGLMLIFVVFFGAYVYIQKNEDFTDQSILNPICFLFNGETPTTGDCSSITSLKTKLDGNLKEDIENQTKDILVVLKNIYREKNYLNTKDVLFLKDKTKSKLKVIEILAKFDALKDAYTGFNRSKIKCSNINIDGTDNILTAKCEAYSMGFEKNIIGFDGTSTGDNKVKGTSISLANSFLNYIEKEESENFILIDKQKIFTSTDFVGEDGYTNKTPFDLKLKINF